MLVLECGDYSAIIEPEKGGLVSGLIWNSKELLYSPKSRPQAPNGIHLYGCWPLVPFANRAFEGQLRFNNTKIQLVLNDENSTMHGFGWQNNWVVEANTSQSVILIHKSENAFLPFKYIARQTVLVDEKGALFSLEVENLGDTPLPHGIGFHPWFYCNKKTSLSVNAEAKMNFGAKYRPTGRVPLDCKSNFAQGKLVKTGQEIAINYLGWDGTAQLNYSDYTILIEASDTLRAPVLWTPAGAEFVCFEPQSHASGAPSELAAQVHAPMTVLQPNQKLKGWMRIGVLDD